MQLRKIETVADLNLPAVAHRPDGSPYPYVVRYSGDGIGTMGGYETRAEANAARDGYENQLRPKNKYTFSVEARG